MSTPVPVPQACPASTGGCVCILRDYVDATFQRLEDSIALHHRVVDARLTALEQTMELRHVSIDKAVSLAHGTLEVRLASMNEFRAQLERQAGGFVDRRAHEIVEMRLNVLEQAAANLTGRVAMAVTAITLGFAILQVALHYFASTK